ncbi:TonB-dependent receptor [Parahaliea mediterranea]|uniref:TonB-dependent receptor n=1 Tax=Parahaliea mediterranea TaxID=651086 RepID=A0A939DGS3_9GAMM|nr:TonB-dependent receptor [Parahaliea mediterranea]MBN7797576.1 TonB-dependent receptor [Parahaliea mediterranea]
MKSRLFKLSGLAAALTAAQASLAQPALEEVVVTAQKRAQDIQDVPISITAFSGDYLSEAGVKDIGDVARLTPNFTISNSSQQTNNRIAIRGIGSVGNNGIEPSVGVFIDGVYYPRPGAVIGQLMDVESFEVLRGPQGTLFGRNTPMGALNINTRKPAYETEGMVEAGFGDYDAYELGAVFNTAFSDNIAGRVAIKYADRDGYGENILSGGEFGERDDLNVRGKLLFDFADNLSLLVTADYSEINASGGAIEVLEGTEDPRLDGTLNALYGNGVSTGDGFDHKVSQEHEDDLQDEQSGLSFDINYDFSNGIRLRSISAYREWEADVYESALRIPANMVQRDTFYETETLSQEFQFISPGGETIDWVAGLFYYQEEYNIDQAFDAGDDYCTPTIAGLVGPEAGAACDSFQQDRMVESVFQQDLDSIAVFGQGTWNISEAFSLTLGGRYTKDEKDGDFDQVVNNPFGALVRVNEQVPGMEREDSKSTWFGNANWFVTQDIMLFATASTGYKSGGFNSEGGSVALGEERRIFGPELATNYELGVKSTLLDGSMTANVTAYRTDLEDFQDRLFDGLSFVVVNAGEVRQQGVEADLAWVPLEQLSLRAGISYLDSEYQDFKDAPGLPGGPNQDLTGERKPYSPEWQTSLSADWTSSLTDSTEWFVGASWSWMDEQNLGAVSNNNPQSVQDAYSLVNARIGVRDVAGDWSVTLFGNNLADEGYCVTIYDQPFGAQLGALNPVANTMVQRCVLGAPRTWNVKFNYHF